MSNKMHEGPEIVPRWDFRWYKHEHKPGQPYEKGMDYFQYELPDDKSGWELDGSARRTIHVRKAPKSQSINPATGELRKGTSDCIMRILSIAIPDNAECCSTIRGTMFCRTYKMSPQSMMRGVVSVVLKGRPHVGDEDVGDEGAANEDAGISG